MRCLKEADLMRFIDGSMPNAAHEAVQRHVHGCVRCAGELQRLTAIGSRIDAWLAVLAPEDAISIDAPESLARNREAGFKSAPICSQVGARLGGCRGVGLYRGDRHRHPWPPVSHNEPCQASDARNDHGVSTSTFGATTLALDPSCSCRAWSAATR